MQPNVLIYLHGFNSSPDSLKAVQMREFINSYYPDIELVMPQIALTPLCLNSYFEVLNHRDYQ